MAAPTTKRGRDADAKLIVLVDMDGVIADFDERIYALMAERHPAIAMPAWSDRPYPLSLGVAPEHRRTLNGLMHEVGFFRSLRPIEGAVSALLAMAAAPEADVYLCTAPLKHSVHCAKEKAEWVTDHLGVDWIDRLVLTRDKTLVRGDYLIDDAPVARGDAVQPNWTHVYFDHPYNRPGAPGADADAPRIRSWADWRSLLSLRR